MFRWVWCSGPFSFGSSLELSYSSVQVQLFCLDSCELPLSESGRRLGPNVVCSSWCWGRECHRWEAVASGSFVCFLFGCMSEVRQEHLLDFFVHCWVQVLQGVVGVVLFLEAVKGGCREQVFRTARVPPVPEYVADVELVLEVVRVQVWFPFLGGLWNFPNPFQFWLFHDSGSLECGSVPSCWVPPHRLNCGPLPSCWVL